MSLGFGVLIALLLLVIPGAIVGGIALAILQIGGALFVQRTLKNANRTYGQFATVIALLSWLYLGAQITIYAAEINVVKAKRLWPRSLTEGPTEADRKVYARRAETEEQRPDEAIDVRFDARPANGGSQEGQSAEERRERPASAPMQRGRSRQQL